MSSDKETAFLQWILPKMRYRWDGFRKPRAQVLKRIRNRLQKLKPHINQDGYLIIGSNETLPPVNWLKRTNTSFPIYRVYY